MSNNDRNEIKTPAIIDEIIPGKNNEYNNRFNNQNDDNSNQQLFIENYNEQESALAVIEVKEEFEKLMNNIDQVELNSSL